MTTFREQLKTLETGKPRWTPAIGVQSVATTQTIGRLALIKA